jgi:transcriptional regulator with XRE-family HTH domain
MVFGEIMRGHRRRLGLTQEELAERTGISVRGIRNLEAGRIHAPRAGTLRVLADAFELEAADRDRLFTFTLVEQPSDAVSLAPGTHASGLGPPPSAPAGDGWHTARFAVLVRLDTAGVETYQDWKIIADRDGLDRITLGLTIPVTSDVSVPALTVDVRYGGRLLRHEQPLPHRSQFILALPQPLQSGQSHDCGIITRLAPGQPMRPHYVLTATRPCEQFTLRVRFHPDNLPQWVRRVCGEPVRMMDIVAPGTEPLAVDAVGEIHTQFERPTMYLAHGAQWQPADAPAG